MANIETGLSDKDHYGKHLKELINQGFIKHCLHALNNGKLIGWRQRYAGYRMVDHICHKSLALIYQKEKDEVCSPYCVDSVFFKLLTLAPVMPKRVLRIEDFDYWRAYLRPAVDQGIFNRLRTRT